MGRPSGWGGFGPAAALSLLNDDTASPVSNRLAVHPNRASRSKTVDTEVDRYKLPPSQLPQRGRLDFYHGLLMKLRL